MAGRFVLHFFLMLWNNSSLISDVLKETHFFNHRTLQVFVTLHIKWVRVTLSAVQTQTFVTKILPQLLLLFWVRIKQVERFMISLHKKSCYAELRKFHFAQKKLHVVIYMYGEYTMIKTTSFLLIHAYHEYLNFAQWTFLLPRK